MFPIRSLLVTFPSANHHFLRTCALLFVTASLATSDTGASAAGAPADSQLLQQTIDGILARSESIVSGEIDYQYEEQDTRDGTDLLSTPHLMRFRQQDQDWVFRYDNSPNFLMQRAQASVKFYEATSTATQRTSHTLHIEAPESLRELIQANFMYAGSRLGTFWFLEQAKFVSDARSRVQDAGRELIDGTPTIALKWDVALADFQHALVVLPPEIAADGGGQFVVYTAPELGYVLPRIEYRDRQGTTFVRYESSDFHEDAPGVFFPRVASCTMTQDDGRVVNRFAVRRVDRLNETIDPMAFELDVPQDTYVRDSRPGVPVSIFQLGNQDQVAALSHSIGDLDTADSAPTRRTLLMVANAAVLLVLVTAWMAVGRKNVGKV